MSLTTILNPRYPMFPGERRERLAEWAWSFAGRHLPRRLAYWSFVATGVEHIEYGEEIPAVTFMALLERAGKALR